MGTTIAMAAYAKHDLVPELVHSIVKRLSERATIEKISIHKKYYMDDVETKEINKLDSLRSLAKDIQTSANFLEIDFIYTLHSGRITSLDLFMPGTKFERGFQYKANGPVVLTAQYKDISRPLYNSELRKTYYLDESKHLEIARSVQDDWDELFFRICGLGFPSSVDVEHAAMFLETGWASSAGCAMVYHRSKNDFAKDIQYIARDYHNGELFHWMIRSEAERYKLFDHFHKSTEFIRENNTERLARFFKQFDIYEGESVFAFLENLTVEKAQQLARLAQEDIELLIAEALDDVADVSYFDFGEAGAALLSSPKDSLWRVYDRITKIVSEQAGI